MPLSPYRLFDRLRHHHADGTVTDPADPPPEPPEPPRRGKRRSKHGPDEDRARHPHEDRKEA